MYTNVVKPGNTANKGKKRTLAVRFGTLWQRIVAHMGQETKKEYPDALRKVRRQICRVEYR